MATRDAMMAQMVGGAGFIAALDQSGGSTPGALKHYGYRGDEWADEAGMYDLVHRMRVRIITAPSFTGDKVLAAILFERTMDGQADGVPVPTALWRRGVVPFLKVDKGLEDAGDGVQLMKPIADLEPLLERARALGVLGTKMRSVVGAASRAGIARIVDQQFELGERIIAAGLLPILEPEVSLDAPDRAEAEAMLRDALLAGLDRLTGSKRVMLKLTIPAEPDGYAPLIAHGRVARVVALSGGYARDEACARLSANRGMIASFSRALLEGLSHDQDDEAFDRTLAHSVGEIYRASTVKALPAA